MRHLFFVSVSLGDLQSAGFKLDLICSRSRYLTDGNTTYSTVLVAPVVVEEVVRVFQLAVNFTSQTWILESPIQILRYPIALLVS